MAEKRKWTDRDVEMIIGNILRWGVAAAATIIFIGGGYYLFLYGGDLPNYRSFQGEPEDLRAVGSIVKAAFALRSRGIIQFGLLLLIAVPIARVIFSVFAFAMERDYSYVVITLIVLTFLMFSLLGG
jgi:uncharacterized membrane protein